MHLRFFEAASSAGGLGANWLSSGRPRTATTLSFSLSPISTILFTKLRNAY
jgi:hypothetical protein